MSSELTTEAAQPAVTTSGRGSPRRVEGVVVSDKMLKTRVVAVTEMFKHARYGKFIKRTQKLHVHDEKNESKTGDKVLVIETRPLSATKRWRLVQVVTRAV